MLNSTHSVFLLTYKKKRGCLKSLDSLRITSYNVCYTKLLREFDLLVTPYDDVKIIPLVDMAGEILNSKLPTGKRLGFIYNSDDVKH